MVEAAILERSDIYWFKGTSMTWFFVTNFQTIVRSMTIHFLTTKLSQTLSVNPFFALVSCNTPGAVNFSGTTSQSDSNLKK